MKKGIKYFLIFVFGVAIINAIINGDTDNDASVSSEITSEANASKNNTEKDSSGKKELKTQEIKTEETATPKPTENPAKKIDNILNEYSKEWEKDDAEELKSYNDKDVYKGICRAIKKEYKKNQKEIKKIKYAKIITGEGIDNGSIYSVNEGYLNISKVVDLYLDFFENGYKKDSLIKIQKMTKKYDDIYTKYSDIDMKYGGIYNFNKLYKAYENAETYDIYVDYLIKSTLGRKVQKLLESDKSYGYYTHDAVYNSYYEEYYAGDEEFVFKTYEKLPRNGYYQLMLVNTGEDWTVESSDGFERKLDVYEELSEDKYNKLLKDKKTLNKVKKDGKNLDSEIKKLLENL